MVLVRSQGNVHFIGLVNVVKLEGLGKLGAAQLAWLADDLKAPDVQHTHRGALRTSPHGPSPGGVGMGNRRRRAGARAVEALWIGDGVERTHPPGDAEGRRQRGVPHGDVHSVPATGAGDGGGSRAGPMKVPDDRLRQVLGITEVQYLKTRHALAVVDSPLVSGVDADACDSNFDGSRLFVVRRFCSHNRQARPPSGSDRKRTFSRNAARDATRSTCSAWVRSCGASMDARRACCCRRVLVFRRTEGVRTNLGCRDARTNGLLTLSALAPGNRHGVPGAKVPGSVRQSSSS